MKSLPMLIAMLGLAGCFQSDRTLGSSIETGESGKARIVVQTGKIGALAKISGSRDISLATLEVTLTAPGEEDVSESFPLSGNSAATISHTFTDLASLKTWTLTAVSRDGMDSVIHSGSATFEVRPRQTTDVSLDLSPGFSMLKARLFPVRDSTTRCELWVDEVKRDDTSFAKQSVLGDTIPLAFDYLSTGGSHTIRMDVYGEMWGFDTLLYSEDTVLSIAAGEDASHRMLLKWVGPALPPPGQATMSVALGSVGTVVVGGELDSRTQSISFLTSGNIEGLDMAIHAGGLYLAAENNANGGDGLVMKFALPLGTGPEWNLTWPNQPGWDVLNAIRADASGVYVGGRSWSRTTDLVGGKESKGITVKLPLTGGSGSGFGGSIWDRQTPAAPGAFSYGGHEGLEALHIADEGGVPFIYAAGGAQSGFSNGSRLFLSKLDQDGAVLWTAVDPVGNPASIGYAVTSLNDGVYVAGGSNDPGAPTVYLRKFDQDGASQWNRGTTQGNYTGLTVGGGALFAVGYRQDGIGGSLDFLIEKWTESGDLLWSRSYDRGSEEDRLEAAILHNGKLYAVGSTRGGTAGGKDGVQLEIDLANGDLLATHLFGGASDESFHAVVAEGADTYAAGKVDSSVFVVQNP